MMSVISSVRRHAIACLLFLPVNAGHPKNALATATTEHGYSGRLHDEYLYHVAKDYLPQEALYMIRYHSFYPAHKEGEYQHLMNAHDKEMFKWVREFSPYDLYSKSHERPNVAQLRPFYEDLISSYFPPQIGW